MEINSFAQLFTEAARFGLRLNSFHQLPNGTFSANWRLDGPFAAWFGDATSHHRPFDAARDSFLKALEAMPKMPKTPAEPPAEPDLFDVIASDGPGVDASDLFG